MVLGPDLEVSVIAQVARVGEDGLNLAGSRVLQAPCRCTGCSQGATITRILKTMCLIRMGDWETNGGARVPTNFLLKAGPGDRLQDVVAARLELSSRHKGRHHSAHAGLQGSPQENLRV